MIMILKELFKRTYALLMGVAIILGLIIISNVNRVPIYNELVALDLIPQPERLTELYFDDHMDLPHSAKGSQVISFEFVIHNVEMTDYQYVYDVSVKANGVTHHVDSGTVFVRNNQYFVKKEEFKLMTNFTGSQQVVVSLTNKQQSIDFWIGK